jgi:hypothetical protein
MTYDIEKLIKYLDGLVDIKEIDDNEFSTWISGEFKSKLNTTFTIDKFTDENYYSVTLDSCFYWATSNSKIKSLTEVQSFITDVNNCLVDIEKSYENFSKALQQHT